MRLTPKWSGILLLAVLGFAGCASTQEQKSLYQRLGGREGIAGVVDDFVANAVADPRIGPAFKRLQPTQVFKLKSNLSDFMCDATGGPCAYVGRNMKDAHKGMQLTDADVQACNIALEKALDKRNVAAGDKAQVMTVVRGLMKDIVGQ